MDTPTPQWAKYLGIYGTDSGALKWTETNVWAWRRMLRETRLPLLPRVGKGGRDSWETGLFPICWF